MTLTASLFKTDQADRWDAFVRNANNGTLFHLRQFLSYHPPDRFIDHSLMLFDGNELVALLPAAERTIEGRRILISHPGSSYGGPVTAVGLSFQKSYAIAESLVEYARAKAFDGITLTFPPTIYNLRLSNYMDFALIQHGFQYAKREISSILYLESSPDKNLAKFTPASRRAVKKAKNGGVEVQFSDDYAGFYKILLGNLERRHGVKPTHTLAELQRLSELFPDDIKLLAAYHEDRMIAGITIFNANPDVTLAFYISHDDNYQEYRAVNLLFYELIHWAIGQNFKFLDFGIFTISGEPNLGLARFKESFGSSGMFRDTLSIDLTD
jgi:hypothetical protein